MYGFVYVYPQCQMPCSCQMPYYSVSASGWFRMKPVAIVQFMFVMFQLQECCVVCADVWNVVCDI